jgi:hypothetical protein
VPKGIQMPNDPYGIPSEVDGLKLDALRYLQMIYRDPQLSTAVRMRAAGLALPFESPKLIATAVLNEGSFADLLEKRLKRFEEMKLVEAQPPKLIEATSTNGEKADARLPPPLEWLT